MIPQCLAMSLETSPAIAAKGRVISELEVEARNRTGIVLNRAAGSLSKGKEALPK